MNAEEYFVKEFKKYTDYKAHLLSGASYESDARMAALLGSSSPDLQNFVRGYMNNQMKYLQGADLGCTGTTQGKSIYTEFLEKSLPAHVFRPLDITNKPDSCAIYSISEPYFDALNGTVAHLQPRREYRKRVTGDDGAYIKDQNGKDVSYNVDIPVESRVVLSHKKIGLPNWTIDENGHRQTHFVSDGFIYMGLADDFDEKDKKGADDGKDKKGNPRYLYCVPRKFIYPLSLNVLLLTASRLTSRYYWGRQYYFNRGVSMAYLYIAPYCTALMKPQNVMFCLKDSLDYEKEIEYLESYWRSNGVLYPLADTDLQNAMGTLQSSENNLSFRTLPEPDRAEYKRYDKSLEEMNESDPVIT